MVANKIGTLGKIRGISTWCETHTYGGAKVEIPIQSYLLLWKSNSYGLQEPWYNLPNKIQITCHLLYIVLELVKIIRLLSIIHQRASAVVDVKYNVASVKKSVLSTWFKNTWGANVDTNSTASATLEAKLWLEETIVLFVPKQINGMSYMIHHIVHQRAAVYSSRIKKYTYYCRKWGCAILSRIWVHLL
jgi:hypothetical protein